LGALISFVAVLLDRRMLEQQNNFFLMVGGGAAALAGLIFVAMSINPER